MSRSPVDTPGQCRSGGAHLRPSPGGDVPASPVRSGSRPAFPGRLVRQFRPVVHFGTSFARESSVLQRSASGSASLRASELSAAGSIPPRMVAILQVR
jgi:hypothetical protein